jgi:hypothetical protein
MAFMALEFGLARLIPTLMGPIGWVISAALAIASFFLGDSKEEKDDEIMVKIIAEIKPLVKNEFEKITTKIEEFVLNGKSELKAKSIAINDRIDSIQKAIQKQENLPEQIDDIKIKIKKVNEFSKELSF